MTLAKPESKQVNFGVDEIVPKYTEEKVEVIWDSKEDVENVRVTMGSLRKWLAVMSLFTTVLQICLSSSVWSQSSHKIQHWFGISQQHSTLGVSLYMVGLAIGPLFAPFSERYGRKPIYLVAFVIYIGLQILTVLGETITCLLIGRAFTGFGGGILLAVAFGTIGDLFAKEAVASGMSALTMAMLLGPVIGPVISSYVSAQLSFEWVFRIMIIWSAVMALLVLVVIPETYNPVLLARKARRVRTTHSTCEYFAPIECESRNPFVVFGTGVSRSFVMLFSQRIIFFLCLYAAIIIGVLYSFLTAFPVVFNASMTMEEMGLAFLGIAAGVVIAALCQPLWALCYRGIARSNRQDGAEFVLPELIAATGFVTAGLFMFGWTAYLSLPVIVPLVGTGLFGFGALMALTSIYSYIVEGYETHAVSAIAGSLLLLSIFAAVFPHFGSVMYTNLGPHLASSIFGAITAAFIPMPILIFLKGADWREKSRFVH